MIFEEGLVLRAFIGEMDRHEGEPLSKWLVDQAHAAGLAGATVLRGIEGFGADSQLHTARVLRLSTDLPLVVEIIDTREKIEAFLPRLDNAMLQGLLTLDEVQIRSMGTNFAEGA